MRQADMPRRASASADPNLWAGVIGPVLFVAVFLVLGAIRIGYEPLRHQVSLLSLGDGGGIQTASFLATGLLLVAFALGLRRALVAGVGAAGGPIAIGIAGAGLILAGVFPTMPAYGYPPGTPDVFPTAIPSSAYVHVVGAIAFFGAMIAAPLLLARRFRRTNEPRWATVSIGAAAAVLLFFAASSADPSGKPFVPAFVGLLQRLSIVAGLGWIALVAGAVIRGRLR